MTTLLITAAPESLGAKNALNYAKNYDKTTPLKVFFYGDGAYVANGLRFFADDTDIADDWVSLSKAHGFDLLVCVSAALARGICDDSNAKRHHLPTHNLKEGFFLVGLSEFAMMINEGDLLQFS